MMDVDKPVGKKINLSLCKSVRVCESECVCRPVRQSLIQLLCSPAHTVGKTIPEGFYSVKVRVSASELQPGRPHSESRGNLSSAYSESPQGTTAPVRSLVLMRASYLTELDGFRDCT